MYVCIFAGDNFIRYTGDALKLAATQVLCWDMTSKASGTDISNATVADGIIDVLSNPSQAGTLQIILFCLCSVYIHSRLYICVYIHKH